MLEIERKCDGNRTWKTSGLLKAKCGFKVKKSNIFSRKNIEDFLNKAPNELVVIEVGLVVDVAGACRTDKLVEMKMADIGMLKEKVSVEIPDSKTHTSRSFLITENYSIQHLVFSFLK